MAIWMECIEMAAALGPTVLCLMLVCKRARHIRVWFIKVVGTAFLAVISLGLLLMRLTVQCAPPEMSCADPAIATSRSPGLFKACHVCSSAGTAQVQELLNRWVLDVQAFSAATCVLLSSFVIIRFMLWARLALRNQRRQDSDIEGQSTVTLPE